MTQARNYLYRAARELLLESQDSITAGRLDHNFLQQKFLEHADRLVVFRDARCQRFHFCNGFGRGRPFGSLVKF
jgi:hypothetical protein